MSLDIVTISTERCQQVMGVLSSRNRQQSQIQG